MGFEDVLNFIKGGVENILNIIPFAIFIAIIVGYLVGFISIIYHLVRFGFDFVTKFLAVAFTVISIVLLTLLVKQYASLDLAELFKSIFRFFIPTP